MPLTTLVTGGARGIGLEVCRQLAARGATVHLTARDGDRAAARGRMTIPGSACRSPAAPR